MYAYIFITTYIFIQYQRVFEYYYIKSLHFDTKTFLSKYCMQSSLPMLSLVYTGVYIFNKGVTILVEYI
jgi:hypothetical protein